MLPLYYKEVECESMIDKGINFNDGLKILSRLPKVHSTPDMGTKCFSSKTIPCSMIDRLLGKDS